MEIDDRLLKALQDAYNIFAHSTTNKLLSIQSELELSELEKRPINASWIKGRVKGMFEEKKKFEISLNNALMNRTYMLPDETGESNT